MQTRLSRLALLALIFAFGLATKNACSQAQSSGYSGPGRYKIENVASGKFLDLNRQDQRTVAQWPRNDAPSQLWDLEDAGNGYVYVRSAATGLVMDIDGGLAHDGARVITSQSSGHDSQLWKVEGSGSERRFTSRLGISLDLPHGSHADGVEYETWSGAGRDNQRFRLWWQGALGANNDRRFRSGRMNDRMNDERMDDHKRAYDRGYRAGVEDFKAKLRRTFARHRDEFDSKWEVEFIEGYYDGYDIGRSDVHAERNEDRDAYEAAFRFGQKDYRDGREPNYGRYADRFRPESEFSFRRAYYDGYYSSR